MEFAHLVHTARSVEATLAPLQSAWNRGVHSTSATWVLRLAWYPSGKGEVRKTFMREFDSHPRRPQLENLKGGIL